jgi:hypothetical protein
MTVICGEPEPTGLQQSNVLSIQDVADEFELEVALLAIKKSVEHYSSRNLNKRTVFYLQPISIS